MSTIESAGFDNPNPVFCRRINPRQKLDPTSEIGHLKCRIRIKPLLTVFISSTRLSTIMCGRFSLFAPQTDVEKRFGAEVSGDWEPRYNIAPQDDIAVITNERTNEIEQYQWGLIPHWVDDPDDWHKPINARAETIDEKPSFRDAFDKRRCLVLADGFYEWKGDRGSKTPYRIERVDDEPFAFAGLWETWGEDLQTVTIITTEPNAVMEPIHDRMPVLLERDNEPAWLAEDNREARKNLLDPYADDELEAFEISTTVNNPANDSPSIVEPIGHGQAGLSEFK